jgi:hypothetical protein
MKHPKVSIVTCLQTLKARAYYVITSNVTAKIDENVRMRNIWTLLKQYISLHVPSETSNVPNATTAGPSQIVLVHELNATIRSSNPTG